MSDIVKETMGLKSARFEAKKDFVLPKGGTIIKNEHSMTVREITNGFIISKSYDIKWTLGDDSNYEYFTKEWFTETNPMTITMPKEMSLADKL